METELLFDLKKPEYSYMIGFMQADGHLQSATRNRGRMSIELSERDFFILEKFKEIIAVNSTLSTRTRDTNFKKKNISVSLTICSKQFRDTINYYGVPYGKKSNIIEPPKHDFSESDYWRGILDADGSLGITANGFPFLSLVTASENLAKSFCELIYKYTGLVNKVNRNSRDGVYNIMLTKEKCQKIISVLYYKDCLSLPRKYETSKKVLSWKRPDKSKRRNVDFLDWENDDISFLVENSIEDCLEKFKKSRSESGIKTKRFKEIKKRTKGVLQLSTLHPRINK